MIRHATIEDIPACILMAKEFWRESKYEETIPFIESDSAESFLRSYEQGMLIVAVIENNYIGFAAGMAGPSLVNKSHKMGIEVAWWVRPEHRGKPSSIKMLKALEVAAKDAGCTIWTMACIAGLNDESVSNMYESLGYKLTEKAFSKGF